MKLCFIQREPFAYFGVLSLSGYLRGKGVETDVLIAGLETDLTAAVLRAKPDMIGFSVMTPEHGWLKEASRAVKAALPDCPIVVGGVHAILYPEEVLRSAPVDYVCTGEGERALTALCEAVKNGHPRPWDIPGIACRDGEKLHRGEPDRLLESLSSHFEDREVYYARYPVLRDDELKQFTASRGCPYSCSFCFNDRLKEIFRGKGSYVRMKEPGHFIEEIRRVRARSAMKAIFFADDLFTLNKEWLRTFLPLYRREVGLPFMCTTRANLMTDEVAGLLKDAGCHTVSFGVETGNERIRNEVLDKHIPDRDIIGCAGILRKHGIRIQTSNMFCLPGETLEDALSTVRLNIAIRTTFAFSTLFMPFPGTRLARYCIDGGYLKSDFTFEDLPRSFLSHSILSLEDRERIENVQRLSFFMIKYPALFGMLTYFVRTFRARIIFFPFFLLGTFLRYKEERRISLRNAVVYLWRFRKSW